MKKPDEDLPQVPAWLHDAAARLREPVPRASGAVDAVMDAVRAARTDEAGARGAAASAGRAAKAADGAAHARFLIWLMRPMLSPLAAAAMGIMLLSTALWLARPPRGDVPQQSAVPTPSTARHQFVLVAPGARSVALVGDFNAWDSGATPLRRQGSAWTVELNLPPGRHVYAFVVDGTEWVADASAPMAPVDEFGRPSSVILVPGTET